MQVNFKIKNLNRFNKNYFKNIFFQNFNLNHKINFGTTEANIFFKKKLSKSKLYLEIGSGKSTILAEKLNKYYFSIETSKMFYSLLKKKLKKKNNLKYFNLGIVGDYSYPLFIYKKKAINYLNFINRFMELNQFPDLILVDGRYRVLILLNILKFKKSLKNNKTCILLDDFKNRQYYTILNKFYKIEKIGRMAKLKPKLYKTSDLKKFLNYYLLDPR